MWCGEEDGATEARRKIGNVVMFVVACCQLDEVWDWGRGKGINQIDLSGGGKMIRIMVNKTA